MAIERSLYEMPQGIPTDEFGVEIEMDMGPAEAEIVMLEDGSAEITLSDRKSVV
jgi:hypothetical protein